AGSGRGLLRAWRAKNAGLVWRLWVSRHHGILCPHGNARSRRTPGYLHRILWRTGADYRIADAHCRSRNWRRDDRGNLYGSPGERLLHELDGQPEGRRIRISSAGDCRGCGVAVAWSRRVFGGPGALEVSDLALNGECLTEEARLFPRLPDRRRKDFPSYREVFLGKRS